MIERNGFLRKYEIPAEKLKASGLDWEELVRIAEHHLIQVPELQETLDSIAAKLQRFPSVHSVRSRVKDAEHVVEKLIRKRFEELAAKKPPKRRRGVGAGPATVSDYRLRLTDLMGLRALHLFKDEWESVHRAVMESWDLAEPPIAYVRAGDSKTVSGMYKGAGCKVKLHAMGYRSVHYLLKTRPGRTPLIAELQVRTVFEEAWSEMDHKLRYPRDNAPNAVLQALWILNGLAANADELGTSALYRMREHEALQAERADTAKKIASLEKGGARAVAVRSRPIAELLGQGTVQWSPDVLAALKGSLMGSVGGVTVPTPYIDYGSLFKPVSYDFLREILGGSHGGGVTLALPLNQPQSGSATIGVGAKPTQDQKLDATKGKDAEGKKT